MGLSHAETEVLKANLVKVIQKEMQAIGLMVDDVQFDIESHPPSGDLSFRMQIETQPVKIFPVTGVVANMSWGQPTQLFVNPKVLKDLQDWWHWPKIPDPAQKTTYETFNEIRKKYGLPPLVGGDILPAPTSKVHVGKLIGEAFPLPVGNAGHPVPEHDPFAFQAHTAKMAANTIFGDPLQELSAYYEAKAKDWLPAPFLTSVQKQPKQNVTWDSMKKLLEKSKAILAQPNIQQMPKEEPEEPRLGPKINSAGQLGMKL